MRKSSLKVFSLLFIGLALNPACVLQDKSNRNINDNANSSYSGESPDLVKTGNTNKSAEEVQIVSSPETLTVSLTRKKGETIEAVSQDETFFNGDGARLKVSAVDKGFLYVLYKGSSSQTKILFPNDQYNGGKNEVNANEVITIPGEGWFFFDSRAGIETVYIIYSKTKGNPIGRNKDGREFTLKSKPEEIAEFLDKTSGVSKESAFTTSNGNLIRKILLNHK